MEDMGMKSRYGTITYYMEIPVTVMYSAHPEEKMTPTYPGCPAHVTVDCVSVPEEGALYKLVDRAADSIKELCMEDAEGEGS